MENRNSVTIKVYGQEYSVNGEMPRERILQLADYVDGKMKEIGQFSKAPASSVAVLAAMYIADEVFSGEESGKELEEVRARLEEANRFNDVLRARVEELTQALEDSKKEPAESQQLIAELQAKSRDIESSFFDLQMENIHLKNELESYRNS